MLYKMFRGVVLLGFVASLAQGLLSRGVVRSAVQRQHPAHATALLASRSPRGSVDQENGKGNDTAISTRRACLRDMLATTTLVTFPLLSYAFDNKISNKYDDRPKRRGPKVRFAYMAV